MSNHSGTSEKSLPQLPIWQMWLDSMFYSQKSHFFTQAFQEEIIAKSTTAILICPHLDTE